MNRLTPQDLPPREKRSVEDFQQFLRWAGLPGMPSIYIQIARDWYHGLITIEEGQRIEQERQVWQLAGGEA